MMNPDEIVEISGHRMMIRDVPDRFTRNMLGYGHSTYDSKERECHPGIGLYTPDTCVRADEIIGVWINFGQNLVCPGCGLDFT
jgi:hypothetical protein